MKSLSEILIAGVMWGTIGIFVKKMTALGLDSMQIVFFRSLVAALLLIIYALIVDRESLKIRLRDLWIFIGTGIISFAFFNFCYFTSITMSSVSVAAALLYTAPVFVVFLSAILFKEKLTLQKILAAVTTVAGCLLLSGMSGTGGSMAGILWGVASGFLYALYSIFGKYGIMRRYKSMTITTYTFCFATLASSFMVDLPQTLTLVSNVEVLIYVLCLGLYAIPYVLYTKGLSKVLPSTAAVAATVEPAMACLIGIFYFHEDLSLFKVLGIILILSAVFILNIRAKSKTT